MNPENVISYLNHEVKVNLSLYQPDGSGIPTRQYYSVDPAGKITLKMKSLEQSVFHELVHGLHYLSDGKYADIVLCQNSSTMKGIWSDDEELRTITGHMYDQPYDPICDHVFDYALHGDQFYPRYGHVGWSNGCDKNPPVLATNLINQMKYLNEWKKYQLSDSLPTLKPLPVSREIRSRVGRRRLPRKESILPPGLTIVKPHVRKNLPKFR